MTSEPDGTSRRRPPTIDLTATEIKPEGPAPGGTQTPPGGGSDNTAPGKTAGAAGGRSSALALGLAVGIIGAGAIVAGLWFAGYLPPRQTAAVTPAPISAAAPASNAAGVNEITAQLNKIEGAIAAQRPDSALSGRMSAAEAATKSLGDTLAALNHRVDDVAAAAQNAAAKANAAAAAADAAKSAGQGAVQRSDLDALATRVATLETTMKSLSNAVQRPASADDTVARLTIAAEALRAAVERGAPYQAELATVKSFGVDQAATAPLEQFAAAGVPSAATLAQQLAALGPALRQAAAAAPDNASFVGRLEASAQNLVRVTPANAPAGDDPATATTRIEVAAAHDDIDAGLAAIATLPDAAKAPAAAWIKAAQARNAAIAAARRISADALAALAKPSTQ